MIPRTLLLLGRSVMIPRILLSPGGPIMIFQIPLLSGSLIVILQLYLLGGPIMIHQIHLLGEPFTVPQISLPTEGPVTTPLKHLNLEGLLILWTHHRSGGPIVTPPICLLMFLIHGLEPKAVKPQKEPLAKHLHHSRRTANMNMTWTSLLHEKGSQNPILEINSMILKVAV